MGLIVGSVCIVAAIMTRDIGPVLVAGLVMLGCYYLMVGLSKVR